MDPEPCCVAEIPLYLIVPLEDKIEAEVKNIQRIIRLIEARDKSKHRHSGLEIVSIEGTEHFTWPIVINMTSPARGLYLTHSFQLVINGKLSNEDDLRELGQRDFANLQQIRYRLAVFGQKNMGININKELLFPPRDKKAPYVL